MTNWKVKVWLAKEDLQVTATVKVAAATEREAIDQAKVIARAGPMRDAVCYKAVASFVKSRAAAKGSNA